MHFKEKNRLLHLFVGTFPHYIYIIKSLSFCYQSLKIAIFFVVSKKLDFEKLGFSEADYPLPVPHEGGIVAQQPGGYENDFLIKKQKHIKVPLLYDLEYNSGIKFYD